MLQPEKLSGHRSKLVERRSSDQELGHEQKLRLLCIVSDILRPKIREVLADSGSFRGIEARSSAIGKDAFDAVGIGTESEGEFFRQCPKAIKIVRLRSARRWMYCSLS